MGIYEENYCIKFEFIILLNKKFEDVDVEVLVRVRKFLCVSKGVVEKFYFEICGEIYCIVVCLVFFVLIEFFILVFCD